MNEPKYIRFVPYGFSKSVKTHIFKVKTKAATYADEVLLGWVKWYAPWRCYSFFVTSKDGEFDLVFEKQCLRDIADFCEEQSKLHHSSKLPSQKRKDFLKGEPTK